MASWRQDQALERTKKTTNRQTRLIKLEQIRDKTNSLTDLVRYVNTNMSLSISTSTIQHDFIHSIKEAKNYTEATKRSNRLV